MNNNNRNNNNNSNRRRGRGSNRPQGGGGRGEQLNRIDSRARGNAPQLLEKYRKLASDAHLNGDRVTAESYLQFADHYFRVIADQRLRQEEQRTRRDGGFNEAGGQDEGDDGDYGADNDFHAFDQPSPPYRRDEQPQRDYRPETRNADRNRSDEDASGESAPGERDGDQSEPAPAQFEPQGANPFTRDNRGTRGLRPRGENRGENRPLAAPREESIDALDPSILPPAIAETREVVESEAPAAPRRRARRPRPPVEDGGGDPFEAVTG